MRHPTTHTFLKWAVPSLLGAIAVCLGLIFTAAALWPGVKTWAEQWYSKLEPVVTVPWFIVLVAVAILGYVWAIIYTGGKPANEPPPAGAFSYDDGSEAFRKNELARKRAREGGKSVSDEPAPLNKFFPPTITQDPELMPLSKAASGVYSEFRRKFQDKMPNVPWNDPSKALGMTAHELIGDGLIPIWGIYPPGTWVEKIPDEDARVFGFSGDATEMFDQFDDGRRYKAIQIAKKDFERRRVELRAKYGTGCH